MATKAELIDAVAASANVSKADAERTLGAFFDHVTKATKKGDKISWPGFGAFTTTKRAARTGRNPLTGQEIPIPAKTVVKFSVAKSLKDLA